MISRRDFLKQAGVAASAALVSPRVAWSSVPLNALDAARRRNKSVTLLHDAAFAGDAWGWQFTPGASVDKAVRHQGNACLRVSSRDGDYARFLVLSPRKGSSYTLSGWVKTENVAAIDSGAGAFFSSSQFEFQGRPAQLTAEGFDTREVRYGNWTGSQDWQYFSKTFPCLSETQWFEVAAGLFRASGTAWFNGMTSVEGDAPVALADTVDPMTAVAWVHQEMLHHISRARPSAAILRDPMLPVRGTPSNPDTLAALLRPHYETQFLTAQEISDPARLNRVNFDLLVLPYGETFPSEAHQNLLAFLENGGDFFRPAAMLSNLLS